MWKYSYIGLIQQGPVQKKRWWSSPHWTASSSSSPLLSSFLVLFLSPFIRLSFFVSFNRVRSRKNVVEQSPLVSLIIWLVSYQSASTSSPLFISFPRSCSRSIFVRFFLFFVPFLWQIKKAPSALHPNSGGDSGCDRLPAVSYPPPTPCHHSYEQSPTSTTYLCTFSVTFLYILSTFLPAHHHTYIPYHVDHLKQAFLPIYITHQKDLP